MAMLKNVLKDVLKCVENVSIKKTVTKQYRKYG